MERSQSPKNFHDYCIVIYGTKGIGKTSLTAEFENSLNFQWEPWRRNIELYMVPASGEGLLTWLSFSKYIQEVLKQKKFTTLVMDTIDKCYEDCLKFVCSKGGAYIVFYTGYTIIIDYENFPQKMICMGKIGPT